MLKFFFLFCFFVCGVSQCVPATLSVNVGPGITFSPSSFSVRINDTIRFLFQSNGHTVDNAAPGTCQYSNLFTTNGVLASGSIFEVNITSPAFSVGTTYGFACVPHCGIGMRGSFAVVPCGSSIPISPGSRYLTPIMLAHICLMSIAFSLLVLLSCLFSTFAFGDIWFPIHFFLNLTAFLMATAGFIMIVYEVTSSGRGNFASLQGSPTQGAHPTIGIILMGFVTIQVMAGLLAHLCWKRPQIPDSPRDYTRPTPVELFHIWFGRFVILLSIVQVFLGIKEALLEFWVYIIFAVWYGLVFIILAIRNSRDFFSLGI